MKINAINISFHQKQIKNLGVFLAYLKVLMIGINEIDNKTYPCASHLQLSVYPQLATYDQASADKKYQLDQLAGFEVMCLIGF